MAKNSRRRAAKKTVAKNAVKANQLKLQKRAQTEKVTTVLDKGLGLVYSVNQTQQAQQISKSPLPAGDNVEELLRRL